MKRAAPQEVAEAMPVTGGAGATVRFVAVTKSYGSIVALQPTSLDIGSGEFFAIIGPSGSGKSTLLGTTAGFIPPTAGQILVNGTDLVGMPPYDRNIGMVFQNYSLFPHMTVGENIAFPLRMRKMPSAEIGERVQRMLEMVRLPGFADRRPIQLSGGQQQRVALARAAIYDPLLLLMDEPLGALDKNLREEMQDEIKRFQGQLGTTVLYVTHDQNEAACMADRIAIMNGGRIVQTGTPRELYEKPGSVFVASFLGEANILPVTSVEIEGRHGLARTADGLAIRATGKAPAGERKLALSVRPENIAIGEHAPHRDNVLAGAVTNVVYTAGSVRYRVRIGPETVLTVRVPSHHGIRLYDEGSAVRVSWGADDTLVISES